MVDHERVILHADMDAFYASVEQRDDPALRGRPVAVGGAPPRGVIAAASYEARPFGVRSAIPTVQALKLCPGLILLPPRSGAYAAVSDEVFAIFRSISPLVEPLSLDEAFIDVTGTERLHGSGEQIARAIKARVREELRLVVSIGVAPNKFVAKIASDLDKPDGLVIVRKDEVQRFLHRLPVARLFGVGAVTQRTLARLGIRTIGDLAAFPREVLHARFGDHGDQLWELALGIDDRPVVPARAPKSIGHEDTFLSDIDDPEELRRILLEQADRVARRLRRHGYETTVVVLKAKTCKFVTYTRRRTLPRPTSDGGELGRAAWELLDQLLGRPELEPLRLTGVSAAGLVADGAPRQLSLDEPRHCARRELSRTLDAIIDRYGADSVRRACTMPRRKAPR